MTDKEIYTLLSKIKGGYSYSGVCSEQICFPLKAGGELRFGYYENEEGGVDFEIDLYGGELPPGITGFAVKTGEKDDCRTHSNRD